MGAEFKLTREQAAGRPDITILHLSGWLDAQSEAKLVQAVQQAKDEGAQYVLLELSDMDTITSAGIRAMQKAYQLLTPPGEAYKVARLKLCNAPAHIYQVLGITGFLMNVPNYESLEDAVLSFDK
jgi:anti-anti-sigma factor